MASSRHAFLLSGLAWLACSAAWLRADAEPSDLQKAWRERMQPIEEHSYVVNHVDTPPNLDGRLDDTIWSSIPWTEDFVDIEGVAKPKPRLKTRAKLCWDDQALYIAAELQEPELFATLTRHDSVIFHDPDFEVFINPDGSTHDYYELELNAFNTTWDLALNRPYLDKGNPDNDFEFTGLRTAVCVHGTLNQSADQDQGWTLEIALPWSSFTRGRRPALPPKPGESWRLNFSRVEWSLESDGGHSYRRIPGLPEDNWVWSPIGVVDMHRPEKWGRLLFAAHASPDHAPAPVSLPEPRRVARDLALDVYYAEHDFHVLHGRYAVSLDELGWSLPSFAGSKAPTPQLKPTPSGGFLCSVRFQEGLLSLAWTIDETRLLQTAPAPGP